MIRNALPVFQAVLALALLLIGGQHRSRAQSYTAEALTFSVFVETDMTFNGGDIDGPVALGGNLTLDGTGQMANQNVGTYYAAGVTNPIGLLINGRLFYTGGGSTNLLQGNIGSSSSQAPAGIKVGNLTGTTVYSTQNNTNVNTQLTPGSYNANPRITLAWSQPANSVGFTPGSLINFGTAFTTFRARSLATSLCTNTVAFTNANGNPVDINNIPSNSQVYINSLSPGFNFLNLTGANLNKIQTLVFNNNGKPNAAKWLIINVNAAGTFNWANFNMSGIANQEAPYILFNFYNATTVNINNSNMVEGTVFAPDAYVFKNMSNNIEGQVIAKSYRQIGGEVHYFNFVPGLPPCAVTCNLSFTATPSPATCNGGSNGSITVGTVSNGTAPYQYKLGNGAFQSGSTFTGLAPGTYAVTVKDANTCESTSQFQVTQQACASLGNFVWYDLDEDGEQDQTEQGVPGVPVFLYQDANSDGTPDGAPIAQMNTTPNGTYNFLNLTPGTYLVGFTAPSGYSVSPQNAVVNDEKDSDPNPQTGRTGPIVLAAGVNDFSWDLGLVAPCPPSGAVGTSHAASVAAAQGQFDFLHFAAEGRIGGVTTYEMDIHRVSPFVVFNQQQFVWPNGTDVPFTIVYDPAASGDNRFVFTLSTGPTQKVLKLDPLNPVSGTPFVRNFDGIWIFTRATNGTGGSIEIDNLVLNGTPVDDSARVAANQAQDFDNLMIKGAALYNGFTLTGTANMAWINAMPTQSNINFGVKLGKLKDCYVCPTGVQASNSGPIACTGTATLSALPNGFQYSWTGPGGFTSSQQNPSVTAPGLYTVTVTDPAGGCSVQASTTVGSTACAALGNYVWYDEDEDGVQDITEAPVNGVIVTLYTCAGQLVAADTTVSGLYFFPNLPAGSYQAVFSSLPAGYAFSGKGLGGDPTLDSDVNPNGVSDCVTLAAGETRLDVDAGIYLNCTINDGGTIGPNQAQCGPYVPSQLASISLPEGGSGVFEYIWLYSLDPGLPYLQWVELLNTNSPSYTPSELIEESTWWVRATRRVGCSNEGGFSNVAATLVKSKPPMAFMPPAGVCAGTAAAIAVDTPDPDVTYSWSFPGASPASASGASVNVTWPAPGTYSLTLTVSQDGCDSVLQREIVIDLCTICANVNGGGSITGGDATCIVPYDPDPITGNLPPGGSGAYEFMWLFTTDPTLPQNQWTPIPNTNSPNYDPGPVTETTYYVRCVRRAGCGSFFESNIVTVEVVPNALSLCKPLPVNGFSLELPALLEGTSTGRYVMSPDDRKFITYADGTAVLEGIFIHTQNSNQRWKASIRLIEKQDWGQWSAAGGSYQGGAANGLHPTWDYYVIDPSGSTLTGRQKFKNKTLSLAPVSAASGFQVGWGANSVDSAFGFFGAFTYTGSYTGSGTIRSSLGECQNVCTPDPLMASRVLLEGAYDPSLGMMSTDLAAQDLLPLSQPFNTDPWNYAGTESVAVMPDSITSWILIEVRNAADSTQIFGRFAALLTRTGEIRALDGFSLAQIGVPSGADYFVVVYSRNHLGVMSRVPAQQYGRVFLYDFTSPDANHADDNTYGDPVQELLPGVFAMVQGDIDASGVVNAADIQNIVLRYFLVGDLESDLDGSGVTNAADIQRAVLRYFRRTHVPQQN